MTSIAARLRVLVVPLVTLVTLLALTSAAPARAAAVPEPKAPAEFVALSDVDPTILQEMRYFTPHNFVGVRIDGYRQPLCILTRPAAEARLPGLPGVVDERPEVTAAAQRTLSSRSGRSRAGCRRRASPAR
jgi:hypothetical protein